MKLNTSRLLGTASPSRCKAFSSRAYTATYTILAITNTARSFHANVTGAAGALNATIVIAVLAATMKP